MEMTTESCSVDEHDIKDLCDDVKLAMMAVRLMVMFVQRVLTMRRLTF